MSNHPQILTRRSFLRLTLIGAGAAALAACGASSPPETESLFMPTEEPGAAPTTAADVAPATSEAIATPPAAAEAGQKLVFGYWDSSIRPLLGEFESEHPGLKIQFVPEWYDDHHQGYRSALTQGKNAPDVCAVGLDWLGIFATRPGLVDLTTFGMDAETIAQQVPEAIWSLGTSEGRQLAIPIGCLPSGFIYRADLFKEAGLESEPEALQAQLTSLDDLIAFGRALKQKKPESTLFPDAREVFWSNVQQQGYGLFDGNRVLIEERGTPAAERAAAVRKDKLDANLYVDGSWVREIKQGNLLGLFDWPGYLGFLSEEIPETAGAWRMIRLPGGDPALDTIFLTIPEQSEQKELAWELIRSLCGSADRQNKLFATTGLFPVHKEAWLDPIHSRPVEFFGGQKLNELRAQIVASAPPGNASPYERDANNILDLEMGQFLDLGKDPAQSMRDAEAAMLRKVDGLIA